MLGRALSLTFAMGAALLLILIAPHESDASWHRTRCHSCHTGCSTPCIPEWARSMEFTEFLGGYHCCCQYIGGDGGPCGLGVCSLGSIMWVPNGMECPQFCCPVDRCCSVGCGCARPRLYAMVLDEGLHQFRFALPCETEKVCWGSLFWLGKCCKWGKGPCCNSMR